MIETRFNGPWALGNRHVLGWGSKGAPGGKKWVKVDFFETDWDHLGTWHFSAATSHDWSNCVLVRSTQGGPLAYGC